MGVCVLEGGYAVGSEAFCQPLTEAIAVLDGRGEMERKSGCWLNRKPCSHSMMTF